MPKKSGVTKRSLRSSESEKRPKRAVQNKTVDDSVGLSRQEEQELNKALYASLNDTRRSKSLPSLSGLDIDPADFSVQVAVASSHGGSGSSLADKPSSSKGNRISVGKKRSLRGGLPLAKRLIRTDSTGSSDNDNLNIDESSKDSVKSSSSSANGSKKKIHAQRKFAQGCSLPGTPTCSPAKASATPVKLLSRTPKTEDFLTFLCLRGSPALPPHLDFFNFSKEELPLRGDSPKTLSGRKRRIHESCLDENSSSSSGANDEVATPVREKLPSAEKKSSQSKRSAARASAGTLETARGIVSLRQGLQPKGSSVGAFTPVSSTPTSNRHSQSSQKSSGSRSRSGHRRAPSTIEVLKSARKNLLGKLTSVAKQSEKGSSPNSKKRLQNITRSRLPARRDKSLAKGILAQRRGLRERRGKVIKEDSGDDVDDGDDDEKEEDTDDDSRGSRKPRSHEKRKGKGGKGRMGKPIRIRRRVSERLKLLLQSPHSRRRRLISEDEEEDLVPEQKPKMKKDSDKSSGGKSAILNLKANSDSCSSSTSVSPAQSRKVKDQEQSSSTSRQKDKSPPKSRKAFRVRPPERVRTRGYSSILVSKLALKKARSRDKTSLKDRGGNVGNGGNAIERESCRIDGGSKSSNISGGGAQVGTRRDGDSVLDKEIKVSVQMGRLAIASTSSRRQKESSSSVKVKEARGALTHEPKDIKLKTVCGKSGTSSPKLAHVRKASSTSRPSSAASSASSSSSSPLSSSSTSSSSSQSIPTFRPSESEFADPLAYISKIQPEAEPHGMCKIIPPASWKLDSSKVNEDIRFTPQVQYIHRLYNRWGPNVQRTAAINYHLLSELSANTAAPQIGGVEIDLPQLYSLVEEAGGLSKMADKKQWASVADAMNIPKQAMDRTMRLYDIYCRHVLPYATLSKQERDDLEEEVKAIHELQTLEDEAITRGKSMSASSFVKIARNVQGMWFKDDPSPDQVEREYWRIVEEGERHVSVQCGHINTLSQASAFPTRKESPYSRHPWNLNLIPNHDKSILKYLGPVAGTTIPTMHLGTLFSTSCWSSDPHGLPYIQYLHSGADIIWYCIPKTQRTKFRSAMMEMASSLISNKPRWLKEDCVMVHPALLTERGVKVGKCVHRPREFIVVFPGAHTATVTCGFSMSESVHFASTKWLALGMDTAMALTKSGEKELFAMSALLCRLAQDKNIDLTTLTEALPLLSSIVYKELDLRTQLHAVGLRSDKKLLNSDSPIAGQSSSSSSGSKKRLSMSEDEEKTCEICNRICHLSMVYVEQEEQILCLEHGLRHIQKRKLSKSIRLFVLYNQPELENILKGAKDRLVTLSSPRPTSDNTGDGGNEGGGVSKTRGGTLK